MLLLSPHRSLKSKVSKGLFYFIFILNFVDGVYYILYEEVDESDVNKVALLAMPGKESEKFRFPVPGSPNAKSIFKIAQFSLDGDKITNMDYFPMLFPLDEKFRWAEYIVRVGWHITGD